MSRAALGADELRRLMDTWTETGHPSFMDAVQAALEDEEAETAYACTVIVKADSLEEAGRLTTDMADFAEGADCYEVVGTTTHVHEGDDD